VNNPPNDEQKPVSAKRQKILDDAMAQLKKTRNEMDPTIFGKIRNIIAKNPKMMKALGISELPNQEPKELQPKAKPKPQSQPEAVTVEAGKANVNKVNKVDEKIDQEKNLDIIAKFMTIKPSGKEGVKSMIEKSMKDKVKK